MEEKILTQEIVKELGLDKVSVITADMLDGYTSIGYAAFTGCKSLASIIIPNSVKTIGDYAFAYCSSLTSVNIPSGVTSIEYEAFYGCRGLTDKLVIPDSVTSIEEEAFYNCSSLTSIVIPDSVKNIGCGAFDGCINLTSVIIRGKRYRLQKVTNGKCKAYKAFRGDMTCRDFQYEEGKTYEYEGEPILCEQGFHASLNLSDVFNYYYGEFGRDIVVHEVKLEGVSDERNGLGSKVVAKKIKIGKRIL